MSSSLTSPAFTAPPHRLPLGMTPPADSGVVVLLRRFAIHEGGTPGHEVFTPRR